MIGCKYFTLLLLYISLVWCCPRLQAQQLTPLQQRTDAVARKIVEYLNARLPDSIYAMAGQEFTRQLNPTLWRNVFQQQLVPLLPVTSCRMTDSKDGINQYILQGKIPLVFSIGLDTKDRLSTLLFQPYQQEAKAVTMTPVEAKTDSLAKRVLLLLNQKQADSIYLYAGNRFKQQLSAEQWKSLAEARIFPLVPFAPALFIRSHDSVNKYRLNQYQFIFGLDSEGKFSTLALQPYREDVVKSGTIATDNPLRSRLDSTVNRVLLTYIRTKGNIGLSAGVYYAGKNYYYNYGETKEGNAVLPTRNTLYDIGSITKTFTATLLAIAVQKHLVTAAMPIIRFLPDSIRSNPALKEITLQQLINHTSGLPRLPANLSSTIINLSQPYQQYSVAHLFSYLKQFKQIRKPGTAYEYSNLAAGLLGVLLERIYGQSYEKLLQTYILQPAGLTATRIRLSDADNQQLAQGYNENGMPVPVWYFNALQGAGAVKSNVADLLRYGILQLSPANKDLPAASALTHRVTFTDSTNMVGLGWHYLPGNHQVLQHSGGTGGYRSVLCINLPKSMVVVVLTNNASTGDAVGVQLINALNGITPQ